MTEKLSNILKETSTPSHLNAVETQFRAVNIAQEQLRNGTAKVYVEPDAKVTTVGKGQYKTVRVCVNIEIPFEEVLNYNYRPA